VILVVRSGATPADLARRAREEFPDKMLLGVVLNGASPSIWRSRSTTTVMATDTDTVMAMAIARRRQEQPSLK